MSAPVCARHPGRETGVRCTRCGRPACPACLREAPVGYQCVDCVAGGPGKGRPAAQPRSGALPWARPAGLSVVFPALIAINVAVFVVTVAQAGSLSNNTAAPLFAQWALQPETVAQGAWWQLLTSGFLHIGPLHIAFNMIALGVLGRELEPALGKVRFLVVYLASLLGGSLVVLAFANPASATAGASGAVFGLMGGLAVVLLRLRLSPRPALTLILLNVIISFAVPNISILGHLGGLATGTAVTAAMLYMPPKTHP
ncbi:MAG: rhomboid family intramembrane serine protease [Pseudonocardiaceae bacterium]